MSAGPTTTTASGTLRRDLSAWKQVLVVGMLFGGGALYVTMVGIVGTFEERALIDGVITVGQLVLLLVAIAALALRVYVLERTFPPRLLGDEMYYVVVASNIAAGRGHIYGEDARALRPPAHAWLLSLVTDPDALMKS